MAISFCIIIEYGSCFCHNYYAYTYFSSLGKEMALNSKVFLRTPGETLKDDFSNIKGVVKDFHKIHFDPYDLNKVEFNPFLYASKVIEKSSLLLLIQKEMNFHEEIRELEISKRILVHENYEKFLRLSKTLTTVAQKFQELEMHVAQLPSKLIDLESMSDASINRLRSNREKVARKLKDYQAAMKLQPILNLVPILINLKNGEQYEEAVTLYRKAQYFLRKFGDESIFGAIREKAEAIVSQIKNELESRFTRSCSNKDDVIKYFEILRRLEYSSGHLQKLFFTHQKQEFGLKLANLLAEVEFRNRQTINLQNFLEYCLKYQDGVISLVRIYVSALPDHFEKIENCGEEAIKCMKTSAFNFFVELLKHVLKKSSFPEEDLDDEDLVLALDNLCKKTHQLGKLTSDARFEKAMWDVINQVCRNRCQNHLATLTHKFANVLEKVANNMSRSGHQTGHLPNITLFQFVQDLENVIEQSMKSFILSINCFLHPDIMLSHNLQFQQQFIDVYVFEDVIMSFLRYVRDLAFCDSTLADKTALIFSRVFYDLADMPPTILDLDFDTVHFTDSKLLKIKALSRATAKRLLTRFARQKSEQISLPIRKSFDDKYWHCSSAPQRVRAIIKRFVEEIRLLKILVSGIYGPSWDAEPQEGDVVFLAYSPKTSDERRSKNGSLLTKMDNLFLERETAFPEPEFTRSSIMDIITKLCYKTLGECVRLKTLNGYDLQQMQVDLHYLASQWRYVLDEGEFVVELCEDILDDCIWRCSRPSFLNASAIAHICNMPHKEY